MKSIKNARTGEVFLLPLMNGRLMAFQIIDQPQNGLFSLCALFGQTQASSAATKEAVRHLVAGDVVATVTVPTQNLHDHDGETWEQLGMFPVVQVARVAGLRIRMADMIRQKLGVKDEGFRSSSIGVLAALANACAGVTPWDGMARPDYFEQFLTDKNHPLVRRKFKVDFGSDIPDE